MFSACIRLILRQMILPRNTNFERKSAMKTNRSLLVYILLSIVTFGIYSLFFWHSYVKDVNTICSGDGKNTNGLLVAVLLSIVTFGIYAFVWQYGMQNRLRDNASRYNAGLIKGGGNVVLWGTVGLLLFGIGGLVAMYIQIDSLNKLAYGYNAGSTRSSSY